MNNARLQTPMQHMQQKFTVGGAAALDSTTTVRRAYFDCRFGQLHMHYAIPAGGGFDEGTTLLCIPDRPGSGRFYQPMLRPLGRDRSVYAPDLPGCGESDPPDVEGTESNVLALFDFMDSMRIRKVDVLAHGQGVAIAIAMVKSQPPRIGRLVLSPDIPGVSNDARGLGCPVLVIDLRTHDPGRRDPADVERQAQGLRRFLGLR